MPTRLLSLLLALALLAAALPAAAQPPDAAPALVRIELRGAADLAAFTASGLPALARLDSPAGEYLLAVLSPAEQVELTAQGLQTRILDADSRGAEYYLLTAFRSGDLEQARAIVPLFETVGRRAVTRAAPQQTEALSALGLELARLGPDPISLAASQPVNLPEVIPPDPVIQQIIAQVDQDVVYNYDGNLSGEWEVTIGGSPYTILTRHTGQAVPTEKATQFTFEHFQALGLQTSYHLYTHPSYGQQRRNVVAEQPGLTQPSRIVLITAHLDDTSQTAATYAPGADDNASGSVAVLIAADLLSQYEFDYTIRYVLFTGEEQGLYGSAAYAAYVDSLNEDIVGVVNLDMIAYNGTPAPVIELYARPGNAGDLVIANLFADVIAAYGINLTPNVIQEAISASDHASFWNHGFNAILGIEDTTNDFNPFYHTTNDQIENMDLVYFTNYVKAAVGTMAHFAGLIPEKGFLAGVVATNESDPIPLATVSATYGGVVTWQDVTGVDGAYSLALPEGLYDVTARAPGYMLFSAPDISVTALATTTLDITLLVTPTYIITGYVTDAASGLPVAATLDVSGDAVTQTQTNPANGYYELALLMGSYDLNVTAGNYLPQSRSVTLLSSQQQDFDLDHYCLLVVDDDGGAAYESYYTASLDRLGDEYFLVQQPPALSDLTRYPAVIWLTGDETASTLTPADQSLLAEYLDGGGRLFISGQNIGDDIGASPFFASYLHAAPISDDADTFILTGLDFLASLVDIFLQGVGGANNQTSPGEITPVNGGVAVYDYVGSALYGGVAYSGTHRTVYFAFGFEAINRPLDRDGVLAATLDDLSACQPPQAPQAGFTAAPGVDGRVVFTNLTQGSPWITYTWDFGDGSPLSDEVNPEHTYAAPGVYTVTLSASSSYGQSEFSDGITVAAFLKRVYLPLVGR